MYMRSTVSFLIGTVVGAAGVLLYLEESNQLAIAAPSPIAAKHLAATVVTPAAPSTTTPTIAIPEKGVMIPVAGIRHDQLRRDFDDNRGGGRRHEALDIRAPRGTPVVAAVDGTIRKLFTSKAGGLTIYQYDTKSELCYYYAHLDRYAANVREGMTVAKGDVIGYVGITGNAPPDAPHLHFGITVLPPTKEWWKGTAVDPYAMLVAAQR